MAKGEGTGSMRASSLAAVAAVLALCAGALYLSAASRTTEAFSAATDLPAFHQIREVDIRLSNLTDADVPDDAITDREAILGRYTISRIPQDTAFGQTALGPQIPTGELNGKRIVGVTPTLETTAGWSLAPGDLVDITFGIASAAATKGVTLANVRVLDISEDRGKLVLALSEHDLAQYAQRAPSPSLLISRAVPYRPRSSTS